MAWVRRNQGYRERRHSVEVTNVEMLESGWMSLEDPVLLLVTFRAWGDLVSLRQEGTETQGFIFLRRPRKG